VSYRRGFRAWVGGRAGNPLGMNVTEAVGRTPPAGRIAVVAHQGKSLGGGLRTLRALIAAEGHPDPLWYEVPKSRKAPKKVRKAVRAGADLIIVWGGDGMVQRCLDALAAVGGPDGGPAVAVGIIPAGTANLFASNLGIPESLSEAVRVALHGPRRRVDLGQVNGEHFVVMAGAGFDGALMRDADGATKGRLGRLAYVWTGLRHLRDEPVRAKVRVDGTTWFDGPASCVLFGNAGTITGGIRAFDDAEMDDGYLEVGVATATGAVQWARTLGRMAAGRSDRSPFVRTTRGKVINVKFGAPVAYELDGGSRGTAKRLRVRVIPKAVVVAAPAGDAQCGKRASLVDRVAGTAE
jgi:diacylglycerol kinase (ATP)